MCFVRSSFVGRTLPENCSNPKTSSTGKIFGSVNTIQIAEVLTEQGIDVDRRNIKIKEESIKEVGFYNATVKIHKDVTAEFKFEVVAE